MTRTQLEHRLQILEARRETRDLCGADTTDIDEQIDAVETQLARLV